MYWYGVLCAGSLLDATVSIVGYLCSAAPLTLLTGARTSDGPLIPQEQIPLLIISGSVAVIYLADRSGFWLKEHKQFSPWTFAFLCILSLAVGLATVKRVDSDQGILNREQTDEWKGWMQSMWFLSVHLVLR